MLEEGIDGATELVGGLPERLLEGFLLFGADFFADIRHEASGRKLANQGVYAPVALDSD